MGSEFGGLLDDGRSEKALEVAAAGEFEARDELLRHCGASDDVATLEDCDGETAAGEVGGGGEAVVAAADDDRVPTLVLDGARGGAVADGGEGPPPHFWRSLSATVESDGECAHLLTVVAPWSSRRRKWATPTRWTSVVDSSFVVGCFSIDPKRKY